MIQYRPRLRCQRRGLLEILRRSMAGPPWHPLWATSTAASAPASAPSSTRSPQPHRLPHSLSAVPKPAKSRITHSAEPADRGFGHPRLSGAYRQPKLFRIPARPLLGGGAGQAAIEVATAPRQKRAPFLPFEPTFRFLESSRSGLRIASVNVVAGDIQVTVRLSGNHQRLGRLALPDTTWWLASSIMETPKPSP